MGHLHVGVVGLGAHDGYGQLAVGVAHVNADGIAGVVLEPELRPAPADGGVHAQGDVTGIEAVVVPLYNFQIGQECGQIDGAGHLADAAAHRVHRLAVDIGGRLPEAPLPGPLAHHFVIVEYVPIVENRAVHRLSGQLHVALARAAAADVGGSGGQHVPEQHRLQLLGGQGGIDGLRRQLHPLAGLGRIQHKGRRLGVQGDAHVSVHHLPGSCVIPGRAGLRLEIRCHLVQVQLLGGQVLHRSLHRLRALLQTGQRLHQAVLIQSLSIGGLGGKQPLPAQLVTAVHRFLVELRRQVLGNAPQLPVVVAADFRLHLGLAAGAAPKHRQSVAHPARRTLLAACVPHLLLQRLHIHRRTQLGLGIGPQLLASGGDSHGSLQQLIHRELFLQLLIGEAGEVLSSCAHAWEHFVVVIGVEAETRNAADDCQRRCRGGYPGRFAAPGPALRHIGLTDPFSFHDNLLLPPAAGGSVDNIKCQA